MTAYAPTPAPTSTPLESMAAQLRRELLPSTALEDMFFNAIVRLSVCASFLGRHIEADAEFTNPETPRRLRLLHSSEAKLRYAYEEFRRLKMARQLQLEDPEQAKRPLLAVVATHTTRAGFRAQRTAPPSSQNYEHPRVEAFELAVTATEAKVAAALAKRAEIFPRPAARIAPEQSSAPRALAADAARIAPGRNAQCPCGSGLKYKRCCAVKKAA